ncbi:MAG: hypothetical protein WCV59_03715 [Parcubacteria group bacterium]|jgi:hypothetical protein
MKITILGSISNAEKMYQIIDQLKAMGHEIFSHDAMEQYAKGDEDLIAKIEADHANMKIQHDVIKWYYDAIGKSDAVLVCNFEKNGIAGYIGGNVLMELAFAHVLNKKKFLLNDIPEVGHKDEIRAMQPIVIGGDLSKIL